MPYFDIKSNGVVINRIKASDQGTADALCPEGVTAHHLVSDMREAKRARAEYEALVKNEAERRLRSLAEEYSEAERETWPPQVREAEAVLADPATEAPLLYPLALARGITVSEMAHLVLAKASAFGAACGTILAAQKILLAAETPPQNPTSDQYWSGALRHPNDLPFP